MAEIKTTLKEAIAKATDEERDIANKLAHAVLEREYDGVGPALSWPEDIAQQELALLAKQRTVDLLKLALSRLPEAAQTY
jgi:hypothetical protein